MEWPAYIDGVTVSAFEHAPMRVFMVWHPKFAGGMALFRELHQWLGGPGRNLYRRGLGVPVHAWTSSSSDDPPPPVPLAWQSVTVVVAIVDGELAGRRRWRDWFERLAKVNDGAVSPVIILPWAIHPAAAHLTGIGLLHLLGSEECEPRQLCRRVTEACAIRLMDPKATQPLQIFLSYARRDGAPVALEVRRALQAYGHLSVFLDDHDLQPGAAWRTSLDSEIERGAALFAIVTDLYAGRAWCREELRRFREPRRESVDCHRWWLRPVFILEHLSGAATRSMLEVGNAPIARWDPARATEVVDEFLREILFSEVNRARARLVNADASVQVIHWIPDTWTLLQVLSRAGPVKQIAYPGDGLPGIEVERLGQLFPGVTLTSFEEFSRKAVPRRSASAPRPPILVSISEPPPEQLVRLGLASEHLDDFTVRLARMLLYEGFDVMYGGRPRTGFTDSFQDDSGTVVMEARFINFLGWPFSGDLGASQIADTFGVTRYVRIRWKGERSASRADPWALAQASSATRRGVVNQELNDFEDRPVPRPRALVALGGQLGGFAGFLPGVAEEIAVALEAGIAVYVLGGLGGAAGASAGLVRGEKVPELTQKAFLKSERYRALRMAARKRGRAGELRKRLHWMEKVFRNARRQGFRNGLSSEENEELMRTTHFGRALTLISRGLRLISAGADKRGRAKRE